MWDLWWTKWRWDRFSPDYLLYPCQFHSTGIPLLGKMKTMIIFLFIFITASAAGPFSIKRKVHSVILPVPNVSDILLSSLTDKTLSPTD
jgi:hypothetical protein